MNYRKAVFQHFIVACNNSYRMLNRLPLRCSASQMLAAANVRSCKCVTRNATYSLMTRIEKSLNPIIQVIVICNTYCRSKLRIHWIHCIIFKYTFLFIYFIIFMLNVCVLYIYIFLHVFYVYLWTFYLNLKKTLLLLLYLYRTFFIRQRTDIYNKEQIHVTKNKYM